ncbi:hypothetical protein D3C79_814190 [compost metagenome]
MSGMPNRISGTPCPGVLLQWPSTAAIFAGWCLSVFRPCTSPITTCNGAVNSSIHRAIENIRRTAGVLLPRNRCHAAEAPTNNAVDSIAAVTIWARRYGNDGLKMMANQSTGTTTPLITSCPCGVCIQLFEARIQVAEIIVPTATITVAK